MSATKPSPAPWAVQRVPYGQACSACNHLEEIGTKLVIHSSGKWVAEIAPPEGEAHPTPTNIANAQLTIAAPVMLEALKGIHAALTPMTGGVKIDRAGVVKICAEAIAFAEAQS